jgi:predicted nuclease of predicted toxin-antitoxin system
MPILADHCVPPSLIKALEENGVKVIRLSEKKLEKASDEEVFNFAFKNLLTLFTFDQDFGNILRFNIRDSSGVVIIYIAKMNKAEIFKMTIGFFKKIKENKLRGRLYIIEPGRIRVWPK